MVDAADHEKIDSSRNELQSLLEKPQLAGIPVSQVNNSKSFSSYSLFGLVAVSLSSYLTQVLVLGNKVDLPNALREQELIDRM